MKTLITLMLVSSIIMVTGCATKKTDCSPCKTVVTCKK